MTFNCCELSDSRIELAKYVSKLSDLCEVFIIFYKIWYFLSFSSKSFGENRLVKSVNLLLNMTFLVHFGIR